MDFTILHVHKSSPVSIHTINDGFKKNKEPNQKRFISPFTKLASLFSRNSENPHSTKPKRKISDKSKNVTCINLGVQDEETLKQAEQTKTSFPKYEKLRQIQTQRRKKQMNSTTKRSRPFEYKRIRHQSLSNIAQKFTLFSPNQQKEKLQRFQKKLLDSLQKQKNSSKTSIPNSGQSLKISSRHCESNNKENIRGRKKFKLIDWGNTVSSNKVMNKWRFLADKIHNSNQVASYQNNLSHSILTNSTGDYQKKLIRKHMKHNTASQSTFASSLSPSNSTDSGSNFMEKISEKQNQKSLLNQNYQKSLLLKEKVKFNKISIHDSIVEQGQQVTNKENLNVESSQNKLKKLLKCRKTCTNFQKQQLFTPWEFIPSERQIGAES